MIQEEKDCMTSIGPFPGFSAVGGNRMAGQDRSDGLHIAWFGPNLGEHRQKPSKDFSKRESRFSEGKKRLQVPSARGGDLGKCWDWQLPARIQKSYWETQ